MWPTREQTIYLDIKAVILGINEVEKYITVTDLSEDESNSVLFGQECIIDCSHTQILRPNYAADNMETISMNELRAGDKITVDLKRDEAEKA